MSGYANYVQDFPSRCRQLLQLFDGKARQHGREVTLLLSLTTSALIVPFERLRVDKDGKTHPFADANHQRASQQFQELMDQAFLTSRLALGLEGPLIYFKQGVEPCDHPEQWEALRLPTNVLSRTKQCCSLLKLLRNALAHGNVFSAGREINQLVFLSRAYKDSADFNVLAMTPNDLRLILCNWIDFLSELKLPSEIQESADIGLA